MKLRCTSNYRNEPRGLAFEAGQVFDAEPQLRLFLMADAPGCFEPAPEEPEPEPPVARAVRKPARHKMVEEPAVDK